MAGRLEGKVALITGACSGIGLASLELFAAEGAQVVCADIQDEKGAALERRFEGRVRYARCDVTDEAQVAATMAQAKQAFGGLDILFNNAGVADRMGSIASIDAEIWDRTFAILVRGPMLGMKHAVPLLRARGGGAIVNTASVAALEAGWGPLAYSSAKAAVLHLSRVAAAQLARHRIRVNAICPGIIATPIMGASMGMSLEVADQMAVQTAELGPKLQPIPKAGLPQDIAQAALYLASDASAFVTGSHLVVDGGATIGQPHAWNPQVPSPLAAIAAPPQG
jgi:NAD(P)-dependent dehydrogenase (short-subunit alcohol dehydrogenase family)